MKKKIILFSSIGGALLILAIVLIICLCMPKGKAYRTINVQSVNGTVNVKRNNEIISAKEKMKLKNEDVVEVKESSSTILKLDSDKFVMAKENTTFKLEATGKKSNTKTRLIVEKGGVIVELKEKLKNTESFEIASSNSVMAIRGTQISFNVSIVDNKITTSLAVLDGNTEIYLFKNEKLNKTTLLENYSFSYTTDLTEAVENISEFIDNGEKIDIADSDLETVFNIIKQELTSDEIDEIVDIINEFEREKEEEKVNGVIKFSLKSQPKYKDDPSTLVEIVEDYNDLGNIAYLYSKEINGEYKELSEIGILEVGEWYIKLVSKNNKAYRSDPLKFSVLQNEAVDLKLSFTADPGFMIDPKKVITTDKEVTGDITFVYSSQKDGEYKEYDTMHPLGLGTWFCKVLETEDYKSDPFEFEVVEREIEIKLNASTEFINYCAFLQLSVDSLDEFFNSDYASTPADDLTDVYRASDYKYYILVEYDNPEDEEDYYTVVIDYGHKTVTGYSDGSSPTMRYYIEEYHLPEEFITPDSEFIEHEHGYNFEFKQSFIAKTDNDSSTVYAMIDSYSPSGESMMARIKMEGGEVVDAEVTNHYAGLYSVNSNFETYDVQFYIENTEYQSEYIHVDTANFSDASDVTISSGTPREAIVTYNGNRSMNIYYDINFDGNDEFNHIMIVRYLNEDYNTDFTKVVTGTTKYAVIEDIYEKPCYISLIGAMKVVDGMIYISRVVENPSGASGAINEYQPTYGTLSVDGDNRVMTSYGYFERGNGYVLDLFDDSWTPLELKVTDDDFIDDHTFTKTITNYNKNTVKLSGMAYGYIKESNLGLDGIFDNTALEQVRALLAENGITLKGTNKHIIDCVDFTVQ